jgi:hypothetical protein
MWGSNSHREREIFTNQRAIDRFLGRRYSRGQSKEAFKFPIRPVTILDKLHADLMKTLQAADVQQRLADLVIEVAPTSRDEFTAFIRSETARWAQVVRDSGIPTQ